MNWIMQLFLRRRLFGDLSAEIQEHLAEKIDELITSGVPREEASTPRGDPQLLTAVPAVPADLVS
jgi:hypothetical protein